MPTTGHGFLYPASTGHARLWEHIQGLADSVETYADNLEAWTSFTPSWTAVTTNPVLGNGVLQGRWRYATPSTVEVYYTLRPGSTTTFGSGQYRLSLPVDAVAGAPDPFLKAVALLGSNLYELIGWTNTSIASTSLVSLYRSNITTGEPAQSWTGTSPVTFANGHTFSMAGTYRVAW